MKFDDKIKEYRQKQIYKENQKKHSAQSLLKIDQSLNFGSLIFYLSILFFFLGLRFKLFLRCFYRLVSESSVILILWCERKFLIFDYWSIRDDCILWSSSFYSKVKKSIIFSMFGWKDYSSCSKKNCFGYDYTLLNECLGDECSLWISSGSLIKSLKFMSI